MEAAAREYEQVIGAGIEKVVRRLIKRYSGKLIGFSKLNSDLSKDYEALGGAYNAFSLNESGGSLPPAIETVGQASDGTFLSLQELVSPLNISPFVGLTLTGAWVIIRLFRTSCRIISIR